MKSKLFAVYDISSSSVAGAHVLMKEVVGEKKYVLLASGRNEAPLQEDMDIKRFVEDTVKHLEETVARIQKADAHQPSYIQIMLASPWYSSQTRTILYKKDTRFVCSQKLVDSLIEKEIDYVLKNEKGSFGVFGKESMIVEKQLSQIKLNGYETSSPYDKKAETIELSLTITIAPKPILDRFTDVIKRAYGTRKIGYTTSPFATYVVMRDSLPIEKECVIIDVGEEVTDVAFIKNSILLYQHSFPVGTYALYRALSDDKGSVHETIAILESFRKNKLSETENARVNKGILQYSNEWQVAFRQILDNGQYGFCLPSNCIITSDPRFEAIYTNIIKIDPFIIHSCSQGVVNVHFMNQEMLKSKVSSMDDTEIDIPLATGALFVGRLN